MRAQIKPTYQIQRINSLQNQLAELVEMDRELFLKRPHQKAWCVAEVLKHMIIGQQAYEQKMDNALAKLDGVDEEIEVLSAHAVPSFLIKRFPPKEGKIRLKMKTGKKFKPVLDLDTMTKQNIDDLFSEMKNSLSQLTAWVEQTRKKDVRPIRFNSAIGPVVKFNASEACEFILCHNERHFQQVKNAITSGSK